MSYDVVILSAPILVEEGNFHMEEISLSQAKKIVEEALCLINYSGHQTTKLLGQLPAQERGECGCYDQAIVLKPRQRLEFGREYSLDEIEKIGVRAYSITKL